MNHTFKVIFSQVLGVFVVVSEHVRGRSKSSKSKVILGALLLATTGGALAGPVGGSVAAGVADIHQAGNLTTITQATKRAIINWNSFNVGAGETVQFKQPDINSATLNRVLTASPSVIDGILKANGNIYLLNAAGIVIGKNASVNVGGLVASTLNVTDQDFMAGRDHFEGPSQERVQNDGHISVSTGGVVALLGAKVSNSGYISAQEGSAFLAATGSVTLTLGEGATAHTLVVEKATLDALVEAGGAIRVGGGQIVLSARTANTMLQKVINQTGVLEAVSMTQRGGEIVIDAGETGRAELAGTIKVDGVSGGKLVTTGHDLLVTGEISATGVNSGGEVFIGGGKRGLDTNIQNAVNVAVTRDAKIDVSATQAGDGGTAIVFSKGSTAVSGSLKATGGSQGGDGGFIETSGQVVSFDGRVDVSSNAGKAGEYLLDPDIIIVSESTGTQNAQLPSITGSTVGSSGTSSYGSTSTISYAALEAITSGTISLEASGYIRFLPYSKDFVLAPNVNLNLRTINIGTAGTTYSKMPAQSFGGITFDNTYANIRASGTGSILMEAGRYVSPGSYGAGRLMKIPNLYTESGSITLRGTKGVAPFGGLKTVSGDISIDGDYGQSGTGMLYLANIIETDTGNILLKGGNASGSGVWLGNGNQMRLNSGTLTFAATTGVFNGIYRIESTVDSNIPLSINQDVTLGSGSALYAPHLSLNGAINVEVAAGLYANSFSGNKPINANNSEIYIAPYESNHDMTLAAPDVNSIPLLSRIKNAGNLTIGRAWDSSAITLAGEIDVNNYLDIRAEDSGGKLNILDGTHINAGSDVFISLDKDIVAYGNNSIRSGGYFDAIAFNDINLSSGTIFGSANQMNLSAGNVFKSPLGTDVIDGATPEWRIFVQNSSMLDGAFSLTKGFRRYGCDYYNNCPAGVDFPSTGNGYLFKDVPVINLVANNTVTYGVADPLAGVTYSFNGLVNGDTLADIGITGSGSFSYSGAGPTFSTGGYANVGTYGLTAQNGTLTNNVGYALGAPSAGTLVINKRDIEGSLTGGSKVYDATSNASGAGAVLTGMLTGDSVNSIVSGASFTDKNVGVNKVVTANLSVSGTDANNYNLTSNVIAGEATISKRLLNGPELSYSPKVYDGTTLANTTVGSLTGIISGDTVSAEVLSSTYANKNAGNTKVITTNLGLAGGDSTNYDYNPGAATVTYNSGSITKRSLTATLSVQDKVYDGTKTAVATSTLDNVVIGDDVQTEVGLAQFQNSNVGQDVRVNALTGLKGTDADNYFVTNAYTLGEGNITPRHVTASNLVTSSKQYDGTTTATTTASVNNAVANEDVQIAAVSAFADKNAGNSKEVTSTLTLSGSAAGNYILDSTSANSTADITKRLVDPSGVFTEAKVYNADTLAISTANLSWKYAGDDVNLNLVSSNFSDKNVGTSKTVTSQWSLAGTDANNYTLSNVNSTSYADITKKQVSAVNVTTSNKVYDGSTVASTTADLDNVIANDDLKITANVSGFSDKNASDNKVVTSTLALSGQDAHNYVLDNEHVVSSASITKKHVSANNVVTADKIYDGTTKATTTAQLINAIDNDLVELAVTLSEFDTKNAGLAKNVSSALALTGTDAGNYSLDTKLVTSVAAVTPKHIQAVNVTTSDKVYDGNSYATTIANLQNAIDNDLVGLGNIISTFNDKNAGQNKSVTTKLSLVGTDADNYVLDNALVSTVADINKKTVIAANGGVQDKVYDANKKAVIKDVSISGVVAGDSLDILADGNFVDKNAGVDKMVDVNYALTGLDAQNYELLNTGSSAKASIEKKTVGFSVTTKGPSVIESNGAPVDTSMFSAQLTGILPGDVLEPATIGFLSNHIVSDGALPGEYIAVVKTLSGGDSGNYSLDHQSAASLANGTKVTVTAPKTPVPGPVISVPEPTPEKPNPVTPPELPAPLPVVVIPRANPPVVPQTEMFSPVYASGRSIDSRGPVAGGAQPVGTMDAQQNQVPIAVGTRRYNPADEGALSNINVESINIPVATVNVDHGATGVNSLSAASVPSKNVDKSPETGFTTSNKNSAENTNLTGNTHETEATNRSQSGEAEAVKTNTSTSDDDSTERKSVKKG